MACLKISRIKVGKEAIEQFKGVYVKINVRVYVARSTPFIAAEESTYYALHSPQYTSHSPQQ